MKNIPDDTIYRTPKGTRVRIVKPKEHPIRPSDPDWLKKIKNTPDTHLTVAEVANGKRWYGYEMKDLVTEAEFLNNKRKCLSEKKK